ncbi:Thermitase [Symbiodinium pilosum]|uniref:Thermitase protein n=1 Tax=Symbiodinium pilosum TaxID=2952 RepID=A0A812W811_SYMPI|nr:Thermitase [Symbiodinium pilosum]
MLLIKRAVSEQEVNFYNVYWGSSATEILNLTSRSVSSLSDTRPTCSGPSCSSIQITEGSGEWTVSRSSYSDNEEASITLLGPAEIRFTYLHTERCCDKLQLLDTFYSGFTTPANTITLSEGVHVATWSSDFSVTHRGWSFTYVYQGVSSGRPGLIASLPKPEGQQDLALPIAPQPLVGTHFIVKLAYDLIESDASIALAIQDVAPNQLAIDTFTFTDTDLGTGVIGGQISISTAASVSGFRVYWGQNSTHPVPGGFPGLQAEYWYLQVENQVWHPQTSFAFPGVAVEDQFAARWTGYISIATGGNYIFTLNSDEGSRFLGILKSLSW